MIRKGMTTSKLTQTPEIIPSGKYTRTMTCKNYNTINISYIKMLSNFKQEIHYARPTLMYNKSEPIEKGQERKKLQI